MCNVSFELFEELRGLVIENTIYLGVPWHWFILESLEYFIVYPPRLDLSEQITKSMHMLV